MKTIEVTFAFEIGDEVVSATAWQLAARAAEQYRKTHESKSGGYVPKPGMCVPVFQIIERIAQECPGGVQRHYRCRGYVADKYGDGASHLTEVFQFLEHELTLFPDAPSGGQE